MSRLVTAQPNEGVMYELDAIAAAVIGGTSLSGGVGTVSGTLIGSFVIGILRNGLNMNGVSAFTQQIIIGLVILLTVWIDQLPQPPLNTKDASACKLFCARLWPLSPSPCCRLPPRPARSRSSSRPPTRPSGKTSTRAPRRIKQIKGHTLTFSGPAAESAIADQVNLVENAVNRKVAGIVLAPSDPTPWCRHQEGLGGAHPGGADRLAGG